MAQYYTGYKRHFPRISKFLCCFSFSLKTSINMFSVAFLAIYIYTIIVGEILSIVFDTVRFGNTYTILDLIFYTIAIVCLLSLLFGINTGKLPFMKQFMFIYPVIIIYVAVMMSINTKLLLDPKTKERSKEKQIQLIKESGQGDELVQDELEQNYLSQIVTRVFIYVVYVLMKIYYYFVTCSYIEDIEENGYDVNNVRYYEEY